MGNDLSGKTFCDLFAGTGIVGRILKKEVRRVISNDIEYYSFVLNRNYIGNHRKLNFEPFIDKLNALAPSEGGFIYENYCMGSLSGRQYFSDENGKKTDAMRKRIETWFRKKKIDEDLYYFLLACLLEAVDKIANTASVYGAFLKKLKRTAQKDLILEPALFDINDNPHEVYQADANDLIHKISGDILYLDPPYNERQYGANYHLLNTVAKYDDFIPHGKTGLRDYFRSNYCVRSYDLVKQKYQRFKADKTENRNHCADHTYEYLHILEKDS